MRKRQREEDVLKFIKSFMVKKGYTPTIRDIGFGIGLRSTSSVQTYFDRLVEKGEIVRHGKNYSVRGMKYVQEDGDLFKP